MATQEFEPNELTEIATEKYQQYEKNSIAKNPHPEDDAYNIHNERNYTLGVRIKEENSDEVKYLMDFKIDSHNEIGVSHFMSGHQALLDDIKKIGKREEVESVNDDLSESGSVEETGKVTECKQVMSEISAVDNKNMKKKPKQKRKASKIKSKKQKSIIKHFEDAELASVNVSKKRRIVNTSLARGTEPENSDQFVALLKQENKLLKQKLQDFENQLKIETVKSQVMLKTILRLKTKNEKLRNETKTLEQDLNCFKKSNKEMSIVIDVMEEHNEDFDDEIKLLKEFKHPIAIAPKVSKLCQKVKKLESRNEFMVNENKCMMKEVEEFIKTNKHLSQWIYDLEKHNENTSEKLDSVKEENKTLNGELQQFMNNNNNMSQIITNLKNQNEIIDGKLKISEANNTAKAQKIEVLQSAIENFKKAYLDILQACQFSDKLQSCKKNIAIKTETTLEKCMGCKNDELSPDACNKIV